MSDQRFSASVNCRHRNILTTVMARVPVGGGSVIIAPEEDKDLRDLAGALNYWATQPGACSGGPVTIDMQPEIMYGDNSRKLFTQYKDRVTVFPFRVPNGPFVGPNGPLMYMSAAEFQGAPLMRRMVISDVAGDIDTVPVGSPLRSDGKQPTVYFKAGVEVPLGALMYVNLIATEDFIPGQSGSGFSISWPQV